MLALRSGGMNGIAIPYAMITIARMKMIALAALTQPVLKIEIARLRV